LASGWRSCILLRLLLLIYKEKTLLIRTFVQDRHVIKRKLISSKADGSSAGTGSIIRNTEAVWRYSVIGGFPQQPQETRSPAVAHMSHDASCLSAVSFNSTIPRAQSFIISYFDFQGWKKSRFFSKKWEKNPKKVHR